MDLGRNNSNRGANRRSFLRAGLAAAGAATSGAGLLAAAQTASGKLSSGDAAILRFHAALELLEFDFWEQYNELGGVQDSELPGGSGNAVYTAKLSNLDSDMAQYIHDNTEDEFTHFNFLNAYLASQNATGVNLEQFRTLPGSTATGSSGKPRLTNLMQLTLDTSWWSRYRARNHNPDLTSNFTFPQAVPDLSSGQWTAIPRTDADLSPDAHIQAIANTAAFHFATVEQGGSSLYPQHAQRAASVEVLRILLSIGPTETSHFQTWHDKAGNAVSTPLAPLTDPTNGLKFPISIPLRLAARPFRRTSLCLSHARFSAIVSRFVPSSGRLRHRGPLRKRSHSSRIWACSSASRRPSLSLWVNWRPRRMPRGAPEASPRLKLKTQLHIEPPVVGRGLFRHVSAADRRILEEIRRPHDADRRRVIHMVQNIARAEGERQVIAVLRGPSTKRSAAPAAESAKTAAGTASHTASARAAARAGEFRGAKSPRPANP